MIKPTYHNAINFTNDFLRSSKFFEPKLQRREIIVSECDGYLSFEFTPTSPPEGIPTMMLSMYNEDGSFLYSKTQDHATELTASFMYFFKLENINTYVSFFGVALIGFGYRIYSERVRFVAAADLATENICTIIGANADSRHGYLSTYPACGFFEFSELKSNVFGSDIVEYSYSYGRKKTLSSENYIKRRLTFHGLTMYQQNLLKWLCKTEGFTIDGVSYCLVSEFTEKLNDENSEILDLTAEFNSVTIDNTAIGAEEAPSNLRPTNLFL